MTVRDAIVRVNLIKTEPESEASSYSNDLVKATVAATLNNNSSTEATVTAEFTTRATANAIAKRDVIHSNISCLDHIPTIPKFTCLHVIEYTSSESSGA